MIPVESLLKKLSYDKSPHYCRVKDHHPPEISHIFRSAETLGVNGIYVLDTGPGSSNHHHVPSPTVYIAGAAGKEEARSIHRKLWNLCYAPFAIVLLPEQVRVYTGFNYSEEKEDEGLLDTIKNLEQLNRLLDDFNALSIDTGHLWKSRYAEKLDPAQRVDRRLLKNIHQLGEALTRVGGLKDEVANALIGKFVYLKYLFDRNILTNEWMHENNIAPEDVFSLQATVKALKKLICALEERFNGRIFPIDFDKEESLRDEHVKWVAAIFGGAKIEDKETPADIVLQLHLPFKAYDFEYIPVETLSAIYEQFIFDRKTKGAVYTPEALADYLIAGMESVKPLKPGMKILDPACGSGIFLVLIYRLLIEKEFQRQGRKLHAEELLSILTESIYGVEREAEACYVAEFSLLLTLLHYLEPRDLQNLNFRFPCLHNRQIFESDFFDMEGVNSEAGFWQKGLTFDWIIGNPPWVMLNDANKKKENEFAFSWMTKPENKLNRPVGDYQTAEAFSWLVDDLLTADGVAGLLIPATSLFNKKAGHYRREFFKRHEIIKVTNFANLREVIWGKRESKKIKNKPSLPPAVLIYRIAEEGREKTDIVHYGPFSINRLIDAKDKPWVITINENEISTLSHRDIESGESLPWKLAIWGTYIDGRTIERIRNEFPKTLKELCRDKKWWFYQGPELRNNDKRYRYHPELKGFNEFDTTLMRKSLFRFSVPVNVLSPIPAERCYARRGEKTGIHLTHAPHIIMSSSWMSFIIYSEKDFLIPPRQIGISASEQEDEDPLYLKALSIYLHSKIVSYYLFFHTPEWGIFRHAKKVTLNDVKNIPIPNFTVDQVKKLAEIQEEAAATEKQKITELISALKGSRLLADNLNQKENAGEFDLPTDLSAGDKEYIEREISTLREELQKKIDDNTYEILKIPRNIRQIVNDFFEFRLPLDSPSKRGHAVRKPTEPELEHYARELRDKLDDFLMGESFNRVRITYSDDLIECIVEVTGEAGPIPLDSGSVKKGTKTMNKLLAELAGSLRRQLSQWVYVRRGLRLFSGPKIYLYKSPRIIDWTRTRARIDAGEIIGELIRSNDS